MSFVKTITTALSMSKYVILLWTKDCFTHASKKSAAVGGGGGSGAGGGGVPWNKESSLEEGRDLHNDVLAIEYNIVLERLTSTKPINVIPLRKEDFDIPKVEDFPPQLQKVLSFNAVKWVQSYKESSFANLLSALS